MNEWVISDTHFLHDNIIKYCNRPFANHDEMDWTMVKRWNGRVKPEDTCYHLGDVGLMNGHNRDKLRNIIALLSGKKVLVLGNHDNNRNSMLELGFDIVVDRLEMTVNGQHLLLQHYPVPYFDQNSPKCDLVLHGHIHNSTPEHRSKVGEPGDLPKKNINLSVEVINYEPVSLPWVVKRGVYMKKHGGTLCPAMPVLA